MPCTFASTFAHRASLLLSYRDVLEGRVEARAVPAWCEQRGWSEALLGLSDEALAGCEEHGLDIALADAPLVPSSLLAFARALRAATAVPALSCEVPLDRAQTRRVRARKRLQLASLLAHAKELARDAHRIVDVGTGHGHLPRLASAGWEKQALGVDRDPTLLQAARGLALGAQVEFQRMDVLEASLVLERGDLAMGLHACGELGDALLRHAASAAASVVLVSCCFQKVRAAWRRALSKQGQRLGVDLPHGVLGLANLSQRTIGVEASLRETMHARTHRHALRLLLRERGVPTRSGEEMRGINRRQALAGLEAIASKGLMLRDLAPASKQELAHFAQAAERDFGVMRRLSLPRAMLARLLEVTIVTDRAVFLEEHGYEVRIATVFEAEVSPRNLGIFGRPA
jgi:hypothetical protein